MTIAMIRSMLSRADRLLADLEDEYQKCLHEKAVSTGALNLTHEVIEKCTNTLDQLMTHAWTVRIRPTLANPPARGGYFPAARDEAGFRSSLGHWQSTDLDTRDPDFARVLRSYQTMTDRRVTVTGWGWTCLLGPGGDFRTWGLRNGSACESANANACPYTYD